MSSMVSIVRRFDPARRIAVALLTLIVLPALVIAVYEVNALSSGEQLIGQVYRQQLDMLLWSLNQYSWDVAGSWATSVDMARREPSSAKADESLRLFLSETPALQSVVLADSALVNVRFVTSSPGGLAGSAVGRQVLETLTAERNKLERLDGFRRQGYRKLEPLTIDRSASGGVMLVYAAGTAAAPRGYAGLIIDERTFIEQILLRRAKESAGPEFAAAVFHEDELLFSSDAVEAGTISQRKALWLFPSYSLGITLKGASVEQILQQRLVESLVLIAMLMLLLLTGVWFIYRTVRREMELVRIKSDFVANISHELRTPLAMIRMYAETLEMGRVRASGQRKEYYTTILRETERLTRLVNNILNFSRMDAGRRQFHKARCSLRSVVEQVAASYRDHLTAEGFTLTLRLPEPAPEVHGDAEALTEAVINLLDNAVKYAGSVKSVILSVRTEGERAVIEVQDHGIGIAKDQQNKIFDTFYRASDPLVHNTKGSGLGLAMVKHIAEAHDGSVSVESTPGAGSTFRVSLPLDRRKKGNS